MVNLSYEIAVNVLLLLMTQSGLMTLKSAGCKHVEQWTIVIEKSKVTPHLKNSCLYRSEYLGRTEYTFCKFPQNIKIWSVQSTSIRVFEVTCCCYWENTGLLLTHSSHYGCKGKKNPQIIPSCTASAIRRELKLMMTFIMDVNIQRS